MSLAYTYEFGEGKMAGDGGDSLSLTKQVITHPKSQPGGQKPTSAMIPTGDGLPALSKKYVDKILAGKFVDLADLPIASGKMKAIPSTTRV